MEGKTLSIQEKPTTAFVLSLISGILILIGGVSSLVFTTLMVGTFGPAMGMMGPGMMWGGWGWGWWSGLGIGLSIVGVAFGVIVTYSAIMLNSNPSQHATWGTLILVFSVLSFIGAWAGFGVGLILGIIGGALALSWKPAPATLPTPPQPAGRFCTQCGRAAPADAKFCSHCGKELSS